jgi:putative tryptophan/tyrosine transport system substrate-binding protein
VQLRFFNASDLSGIKSAFGDIVQQRTDALFVSADGFLLTRSDDIVALASQNAMPAVYGWEKAVRLGGLMSYGTNWHYAWRQAGTYAGRILKGERPALLRFSRSQKSSCSSIK